MLSHHSDFCWIKRKSKIVPLDLRSLNYAFTKCELSITQKIGVITCISISLLNVICKLASECIFERLKQVLHYLINEEHTGVMSR